MTMDRWFFGFTRKEGHLKEFEPYMVSDISINVPCGGSA
jgi:hypothetical protein